LRGGVLLKAHSNKIKKTLTDIAKTAKRLASFKSKVARKK
jgi:hypothetical protein